MLAELPERNADNVARTSSYLEAYTYSRQHPPELPWLLMAHLVSRNAGYLMGDVARTLESGKSVFATEALEALFLFLERANFLIFHDAWHHVLHHLLGRTAAIAERRISTFVRGAWQRYQRDAARGAPVNATLERSLVLDLVTNEQNTIERRVVHHPRFDAPRAIVAFVESIRKEEPIVLPGASRIVVGDFRSLDRRIEVGRQIFDEAIADRGQRDAAYTWACAHPHDGSRATYGGRPGPRVRDAWPASVVRSLWTEVHSPPEPDPGWP
jgi:hypothetical protein